ncbi:MAG: hypothetical protein H6573_17850 [Lewinellaceae bacterium]|nr:hypothetical protein [Phaeodactylibacter sp.]MCB0612214.1 hypothetical protein [Phaeodactylibacter sp.]MCB9349354.1 hypothetical protein [Lewinellaceae bacterium]
MVVVVDSGSTKADWKMVNSNGMQSISTMGFNPVFHTENKIYQELQEVFDDGVKPEEATQVYYYGAGCWDAKLKSVVSNALTRIFYNADIEVEHDLLGAARATCLRDPGISCILGTGSNSCLYDGTNVTDNVTNLGYLLGDEGSGTHLGKSLIRAYFYRELPQALTNELDKAYPGGKQAMLDKIYGKGTPNVYLASFTKFMSHNIEHPFIQRLLYNSFAEFIDRHARKYHNHLSLPIHFIGSVAYYFQDVIRAVLEERAMTPGRFIQKPIDNLVSFHTKN